MHLPTSLSKEDVGKSLEDGSLGKNTSSHGRTESTDTQTKSNVAATLIQVRDLDSTIYTLGISR
jgi:hypothetical protein